MIAPIENIRVAVAYGYVRVSRAFQAVGTSLDEQRGEIARYFNYALKPRGVQWGEFYTDTTSASLKPMSARPQGGRIIQQLERGDHIIISKLDRGFRNAKDALTQIEAWDACGINVHLLDMPGQDLASPAGRFIFTMMAAMAQFETNRRRERLLSNKEAAYAQGRAFNHPPILWKRVNKDGIDMLALNEHHRAVAAKIVDWRQQKHTYPQIVAHLKQLDSRRSDGRHWTLKTCIRAAQQEMWLRQVASENGGELPKGIMPPRAFTKTKRPRGRPRKC